MILSRSLARIRPLSPDGWGLPYVLDYKRGRMTPYLGTGEWDRTRDKRLWLLDQRGRGHSWRELLVRGIADLYMRSPLIVRPSYFGFRGNLNSGGSVIGSTTAATYAFNTTALDSAYTYGSAGDAVAARLSLPSSLTFDTIYFFITAYTGVAALVNDIDVEIRNDDATNNKPNTTLHEAVAVDPASATGWIAASGFTFAGTANVIYWPVVADADNDTVNFATINRNFNVTLSEQWDGYTRGAAASANGFSTFSQGVNTCAFVVKFASGEVWGNANSAAAASGNTQNDRGWYLSDGLTETLSIYGFGVIQSAAGMSAAKVHVGAGALPNDTPAATWSTSILSAATETGYTGTPYTVAKETPLSVVMDYAANATSPNKVNIGTGADANLRAARLGSGAWYWREQTAGGVNTWTNDDTNAQPRGAILVQDQVAVAAGSGTGMSARIVGGLTVG